MSRQSSLVHEKRPKLVGFAFFMTAAVCATSGWRGQMVGDLDFRMLLEFLCELLLHCR